MISEEVLPPFSTLLLSPQGMDQSELDSNPSFPPTPVSVLISIHQK